MTEKMKDESESPSEPRREKQDGREVKKNNGCVVVNFAIRDCPLWLYKWFLADKNTYNDTYWVRLKEIHDELKFYNEALSPGEPADAHLPEESEKKKKAEKFVRTFGGEEKFSPDKEDKKE